MKLSFLGDPSLSDEAVDKFGGKAKNLHKLLLAGFPVPKAFILIEEEDVHQDCIKKIGSFPVAVRSSGALEDLENASFAGLYETFLFIDTPEKLKEAVHNCFASRFSERVKDYLETKKISWSPETLKMSVIIQKMVPAKVAGVLFTINPTNGYEEEFYIEWCQGVGERLVSGHVTPSRMSYDWIKSLKLEEEINSEGTKLSDKHLKVLADLAVKIQAFYKHPQDIEWAIGEDDQVYILQSRPITAISPRTDRPELTNADFKDGGVSARVCTPFMYSVYREALKHSMGGYFKKINLIPNDENITWIYYHYGRVYWNAQAVKEGLKKIPGYREEDFDRDLGIQKDYGSSGPSGTPVSFTTIVHALPVLLSLHAEFRDCRNMISLFREKFEERDEELKIELKELSRMNSNEFNYWFLKVLLLQQETEKNYFRTIYNNSNFQSEYKSFLKKLSSYSAGDEIDLMGELHGVSHLDVQGALEKLKRAADFYGLFSHTYYKAREEFLKVHYHHGPAELDLTEPRWGERKDWVDELVKDVQPKRAPVSGKYEETLKRISGKLNPITRAIFLKLTSQSRDFLRVREEMRSFSTRAYYLLRAGILEFGRRKNLGNLVFMFDVLEIKEKLLDENFSLPDVRLREMLYEGYRNFCAPNEFGGAIKALRSSEIQGGLKGLGCSAGNKVGRARVILDIHAASGLTHDDILVTKFTDPGWTPVLARVGGVVTEVGGLLSHAAVIGREYGIPAVLNLIDATKIIKDGDLIKIDGKTGFVEILEKHSQS